MVRILLSVGLWLVGLLQPAVAAPAGPPRPGETFTVEKLDLVMIWIEPGTFFMRGTHDVGDGTQVVLTRGYWLGRTEVTQVQWSAIARLIPAYNQTPLPSFFKGSDRPVESITWDMAVLFCAKLNELERAAGRLPAGYEYSLPTEAQWEYACRAGATGPRAGDPDAMAWHLGNSGGVTHPVAQKQPNAWGLHDMYGNVNEWCADWFAGYPGGQVSDPAGPPVGVYRVLRGGAAAAPAGGCLSALRNFWKGSLAGKFLGFRLALAPVRTTAAQSGD